MVLGLVLGCGSEQVAQGPSALEQIQSEASVEAGAQAPVPATPAQPAPVTVTPAPIAPAALPPSAPAKPAEPQTPPKVPPAAKGPAPSSLVRDAEQAAKSGQYDVAIRIAKQALKRDERYAPAMVTLAKAYYYQRKFELATEIITIATGIDKNNAEAYQLLGFIQLAENDGPRALASFKKATELGPDDATAWNNLGAQYLQAKNYGEAARALEKAVALDSALARAALNLGSAYRGLKQYAKADVSYRVALKTVPSYAEAYYNLGILYLDAADFPGLDGIQRLSQAVASFNKYKELKSFRLAKDDPVDAYVDEARKGIEREQKRIEREKKKREQPKATPAPSTTSSPSAGPGGGK